MIPFRREVELASVIARPQRDLACGAESDGHFASVEAILDRDERIRGGDGRRRAFATGRDKPARGQRVRSLDEPDIGDV